MKFSLAIFGAPYSSQAPETAYRFARAALAGGHEIYRLFFYLDGVHNASGAAVPPQDEINIPERWSVLIKEYDIDAVVCIAAALRRGVLDQEEAQRYEKPPLQLAEGFVLSGLGQLIDAGIESDRLITFGS